MIVATIPCSCGAHISWECECGTATYEPELIESCSLVTGSFADITGMVSAAESVYCPG
jgi:hypothetical protein